MMEQSVWGVLLASIFHSTAWNVRYAHLAPFLVLISIRVLFHRLEYIKQMSLLRQILFMAELLKDNGPLFTDKISKRTPKY